MMETNTAAFSGLVDLAAERLGGKAVAASDEFFAEKENLLKPGRGIFIPDKYTDRGKWMDGWESRRKRVPGHDWCIINLGLAGVIRGVDIDTNHFLGNHPPVASLEACSAPADTPPDKLSGWMEILPRSSLKAGSQNLFAVANAGVFTHVRLNIFPDGGVARFRVYGEVAPEVMATDEAGRVDLAAIVNGGKAVACSDMFFSAMDNLIMPGKGVNMGDGWETKRRRGPGHDWIIVKLARPGRIEKIDVDTHYFKGNYPDTCSIEVCRSDASIDALNWNQFEWTEIVPKTKMKADDRHVFDKLNASDARYVRLNIYPDGGVSRMRVWCR